MKQIIISKCFGKMKRVALTLFAALCVGSVWAEEGEATTPEVTPEPNPTPSTPALTIDPSAGYIVRNLGELKDQVAVVFTNDAAIATWKAPKNLKNVEFLAVGGGGGGGGHYFKGTSDTTKKYNQGGSGGGGGAVVTGFINELSANATVKIEVGDGGDKGSKTTDPAQPTAAENGGKSVITIDDVVYITAFGGGGDGGFASSGVAIGGSNSGSRGRYEGSTASITAVALADVEYIGSGADVSNVVCMRNKGSDGYQTNSGAPGGGGGGAISAGIAGRSSGEGGRGGDGYESDITGEIRVYGSGGGGGLGKTVSGTAVVAKGGVGAGSAYADGKAAGHALANQGGGGAGGSFKQDGGNGGSGIVVLRFAYFESDIRVDVAANIKTKISSKAYTGDAMTSGLVSTYAYEVVELTSDLINPGEKKVRVTLNDGYFWSDGDTNKSKVFNWYIAAIESMDNGYKVVGLGEKGDEVALVFTNHAQEITWIVPKNLRNVEFLAVGGGGAGGADGTKADKWTGGVGGGGGGVVVGSVANLASGANVIIKVGVGGKHGKVAYDPIGNNVNDNGMATAFASDSYFKVDGTVYVTAKAGGSDLGFENGGQDGGSGAGARSAGATRGNAIDSFIIQSDNVRGEFFGNDGGDFGSYSCGGGGGAMTPGVKADGGFGHGGQGLESWITGKRVVYGSGGGGGSAANANGGKGGEGAGDGNQVHQGAGSDALPNQGGGGGGGGGGEGLTGEAGRGGDGGSGIVVLRYKVYAAEVNSTPYDTLSEAVTAAANGATITVLNDCTADTACVIANKTLTIDLNGKTVNANDTDAATDGNGVFWVQTGGVLTLEDSSEDKTGTVDGNGGNGYKMAIWADGGKVVINAGNYVNDNDGTHNQYDLIYVKNGGEVVINGGTFKCDTPRWTLNSHNTKTGTFVVTGGKFYQYNPTDFDTDEAVTTWCDAKYRAEADGDWYVIKEGYTVTEESAATVTADTEAEALAQVDFSVTTPDGVDAEKYNDYFKLVATETAEGSKTWTVALALKDEVKPVIAETTPAITFNEDGTVTVNIENKLPGLNYGVRYATTVEAVETTAPVAGFTVTPAEGDTAGFFKVVVDFKEIK